MSMQGCWQATGRRFLPRNQSGSTVRHIDWVIKLLGCVWGFAASNRWGFFYGVKPLALGHGQSIGHQALPPNR